MKTKLTKKQIIITTANKRRTNNTFIINKVEEGQQTIFVCIDCKEERDFSKSVEYGSAVTMWRERGNRCVTCYRKLTGELLY